MRRVKAQGLRSKRSTRDCRPSWSPVPAMDSLSQPRTAMETPHPKTRAQPSPLTTMLDRSVHFSLFFFLEKWNTGRLFKLWIRINHCYHDNIQSSEAASWQQPNVSCFLLSVLPKIRRTVWMNVLFYFISRFHTTSQGLSAETRTPSLRILFLQWSVSTQGKRAHGHIAASEHIWCTRFHTLHTKALCVKESLFLYLCVFHHTRQTAQAVCSSSIDVARCGVISLAAHRQALCGRQAPLTSSSLITVIPAMELIF